MNCHLPTEILQHIIELVPTHPYDVKLRQENKETLFTCALVCKTWMLLSRRRFLSLYFPSGRIAIDADPREILSLNDLFRSPLCTLDPAWIKLLLLNRYMSFREDRTDFFASLSLLDARKFPSLRAIELEGNYQVRFHEDGGDDDSNVSDNPVQPHLSPIKSLKILTGGSVPFEDVISVIHLFPSLEQLTVSSIQDDGYGPILRHHCRRHHHHPFPNPPMSLRKLTLGTLLLPEMTRWMMSHPQDHLNISSFTLISSWWNSDSESDYLRSLLDGIGPSLEELVLKVVDYGPPFEFKIPDPSVPFDQFRKNTSIKRFTLTTEVDAAVKILRYLLAQPHFASQLEVLQVNVSHHAQAETYLEKLKLLGPGYFGARFHRPMFRRFVLSCPLWGGPFEGDWVGVERHIFKECLAQWEGEGVTVELRLT